MKIIDIFRLALRIFKTNRLRTVLTILGVSIGIGAIFFLVSLGYGIQELTISRINTSDSLLTLDVSTGQSEILKLNKETAEGLSQIEGVGEISPLQGIAAQIKIDDVIGDTLVNGIKPNYFRLAGVKVKEGRELKDDDTHAIVISSVILKLFNIDSQQAALGKEAQFNFFIPETKENGVKNTEPKLIEKKEKFKIVGIVEDEESAFVYMPLSFIENMGVSDYNLIKIKASSREHIIPIKDAMVESGYSVSTVSDMLDQLDKVFKVIQIVLGSFGIIALIVASIGMFNTMTIALLERTHEIGIMKSLGVTNKNVYQLFLTESIIIGSLGGMMGIVIGWLSGEVVNAFLNLLASSLGGEKVDIFASPSWFIILVLVFSSVVGFMTGIYPAKRASGLNPLIALRYE